MLLSTVIAAARASELLDDIRQGDSGRRRQATDELLAEMMPSLHALCVNTLGSGADAEDALQEALIAIYRALDSFRGESKVSTWAYRITIRVAMRHAVKRKRNVSMNLEDTLAAVGDAMTAVRAKEIFEALDKLSQKHRVVLALFAIQGLSHEEIANVLGIATGTVWSRLHHARQALGAILQE
mgnify:FL=1